MVGTANNDLVTAFSVPVVQAVANAKAAPIVCFVANAEAIDVAVDIDNNANVSVDDMGIVLYWIQILDFSRYSHSD